MNAKNANHFTMSLRSNPLQDASFAPILLSCVNPPGQHRPRGSLQPPIPAMFLALAMSFPKFFNYQFFFQFVFIGVDSRLDWLS
jgi:hypothetical protein